MTESSAAEMRRVLTSHDVPVPERGKLGKEHVAAYERIIADDGDYSGGVTASDFPEDDDGEDDDGGHGPDMAEQKPRGAARPAAERARNLWRRGGAKPKARPRRPRKRAISHPRVPTAPVIERVWAELAFMARSIPPLQRVLSAQAPMAGVILEDAARETFIERPLQAAARMEDKLEAANAMIGPPFWTAMVMFFGSFDREPLVVDGRQVVNEDGQPVLKPVFGPDGQPLWNDATRVMLGGLRFSLMSWIKIGQRNAAEIIERTAELDELGREADDLIAWIFNPQHNPRQSMGDMAREAREASDKFMRAAGGQPDDDGPDVPAPARTTQGQAPGAAPPMPPGWPDGALPDPRGFTFVPPDPHTASQVVPRAVMPQA
jgi:hypothetical protein